MGDLTVFAQLQQATAAADLAIARAKKAEVQIATLQAEGKRLRAALADVAAAWDLPGYENPKSAAFSKLENAAILLRRNCGELGLAFALILESVIARTRSALAAREVPHAEA